MEIKSTSTPKSGVVSIKSKKVSGDSSDLSDASFAEEVEVTPQATEIAILQNLVDVSRVDPLFINLGHNNFYKQEITKGNLLLDELDNIRNGLLLGRIPQNTLSNMSKILHQLPPADAIADKKLAEILQDIRIRVTVEIAKLEQASTTDI